MIYFQNDFLKILYYARVSLVNTVIKAGHKKPLENQGVLRAIDGARTRGLDLGKVARYQLRHYRIHKNF